MYETYPSAAYSISDDMGAAIVLIMFFTFIAFVITLYAVAIVQYVFQSLSIQRIAQRRAIPCPWLAWIPYAKFWIIGGIAKEYDMRQGIKRRWDKALLSTSIAYIVGYMIIYFATYFSCFGLIAVAESLYYSEEITMLMVFGWFFIFIFAIVAISLLATAFITIQYLCLYKIFESTVPEKALKYMIISLLVPFGTTICLFKCSKCGYDIVTDKASEPIDITYPVNNTEAENIAE